MASTSFMFMLVWVPEPVCHIDSGNSPGCFPASTSSAEAIMAFAFSTGSKFKSRFTTAAARLTVASATINSVGMRSVEMWKW